MDKSLYRVIPFIYYSSFRLEVKNPKPLVVCLFLTLLKAIKRIVFLKFKYPYLKSVFYFEPTINNRKSLKTTKTDIDPTIIESCDKPYGYFPEAWIYLYSFINIGGFLSYYKKQKQEDQALIRFFFEDIFLSVGYYKVIDLCLKRNTQLKVIIMANDHVPCAMCLKYLAPKYNVKTIYTQHASVTERFPNLLFDYSFLDGMESYEKYAKIGNIKGKVYLIGSPRFDEIYMNYKKSENQSIGIAINSLDNIEKLYNLCIFLVNNGVRKVTLRPHPCMESKLSWEKFIQLGIEMSYPSRESSFKYLERCNYLISNESSIHLDAAMVGVPSLLYNFSDFEVQDWYGYLKKGLMPIAKTPYDVLKILNEGRIVNSKLVHYYNASHGTLIEGKVGSIISKYINTLVKRGDTFDLDKQYFNYTKNNYYTIL